MRLRFGRLISAAATVALESSALAQPMPAQINDPAVLACELQLLYDYRTGVHRDGFELLSAQIDSLEVTLEFIHLVLNETYRGTTNCTFTLIGPYYELYFGRFEQPDCSVFAANLAYLLMQGIHYDDARLAPILEPLIECDDRRERYEDAVGFYAALSNIIHDVLLRSGVAYPIPPETTALAIQ